MKGENKNERTRLGLAKIKGSMLKESSAKSLNSSDNAMLLLCYVRLEGEG